MTTCAVCGMAIDAAADCARCGTLPAVYRPAGTPATRRSALPATIQSALPAIYRALPAVSRSIAVVAVGAGLEMLRRRVGGALPGRRKGPEVVYEEITVVRRWTVRSPSR